MKNSKKIALCGISAAFGTIFLLFLRIAPTAKLSFLALSSVAVMLPLSKKLYGGAALSVIAAALLGFIGGGLAVFLPYILIFGIHPVVNALTRNTLNFKGGIIVKTAIKAAYIFGVICLLYSLAVIAQLFPDIQADILPVAIIITLAFIPYDILMQAVQKRVDYLINKYIRF